MKKQLLMILLSGITTSLMAQVVMENHIPPLGSTYGLAQFTSKINKASPGANQTWDYSSATKSVLASYSVVNPSTLPSQIKDSVPTATWGTRIEMGAPIDKAPYDFYVDKTTYYQHIGTKNSGSGAVQRTSDTTIMFNQSFNSTLSYGRMTRLYAGYGTLIVGNKTYNNIVMLKSYFATGSTDTLVQFHQFTPYFQTILSYAIMADTIANVIYFETLSGGSSGLPATSAISKTEIYPNPAHESVTVNLTSSMQATVVIRDIQGRAILVKDGIPDVNGKFILNTELIPPGLYILSVQTINGEETRKLIIE
jgi:hypothetical protein